VTPFEKCKALQAELESLAAGYEEAGYTLPARRYAVLGEPVIDCESVIIALTGMVVPEGYDINCGPPQLGTFSVVIARDCATPFDEEGVTIPAEAEALAVDQGVDGDMLWLFANRHQPYAAKLPWTIGFVVTGGLAVTSLQLTTGID